MTQTSWDQTWMDVASTIAKRSRCDRAQIGAVIVSSAMRVVSTGYNGPPASFVIDGGTTCRSWCIRASKDEVMSTYDDCVSIHAEMNAIAYADRSSMEGGTMYVTSTVCWSCAKVIANSGIRNVVMVGDPEHNYSHRNIDRTIEFLKSCGIGVEVR